MGSAAATQLEGFLYPESIRGTFEAYRYGAQGHPPQLKIRVVRSGLERLNDIFLGRKLERKKLMCKFNNTLFVKRERKKPFRRFSLIFSQF